MEEMNIALKECTFGKFHLRLLGAAFLGTVANVLVSNVTAYLLPNAECDLKMNLVQKGLLNAIPYIGMLFSSILAGFLADTFGRKKFLLTGYGGIFIFTLIGGSSQSYEVLVTAKFLEGILFATSFNAMITLTSEFCHNGIRDRVMICQSSFNGLAQIVIAGFSWVILTQEWYLSFGNGKFVLNTWNFYLYLCSLWSLSAFIVFAIMPESPKYLLSQEKYDEARNILVNIYKENTGKPGDTYPAASLWRHNTFQENKRQSLSFKNQIKIGLFNSKPMFKKPLVITLIVMCSIAFLNMLMYNVTRLWFPQLSTIIEHYSMKGNVTQDLCTMLDTYTDTLQQRKESVEDICVPHKSGDETYINSLILGTICVMPYLVSGFIVNKIGKKPLMLFGSVVTIVCMFALRWTSSKVTVVSLFSISVAFTQLIISLVQTVLVEVFPTTTRSLAISMMMMSGRSGTLLGNVAFPILLNMGCVFPFFSLAGLMICVTLLILLLPIRS